MINPTTVLINNSKALWSKGLDLKAVKKEADYADGNDCICYSIWCDPSLIEFDGTNVHYPEGVAAHKITGCIEFE